MNSYLTLVVKEGSEIDIEFQLSFLDGTMIEETPKGEVLHFSLGDGTFLPQLEEMLIGLEVGTTAKLTLSPERAFGHSDPSKIHWMDRKNFSDSMNLQEGFVIGFQTPSGEEVPGTIKSINEDQVEVDFNHPLADQTIVFETTIKAIYS
ncbi:MAG TPA: peptidylprolyl isomerase [Thiomicrorhabdus sp.]|nr:peptidylprolyl isomerase [Thiomicrorhabdus sp.]